VQRTHGITDASTIDSANHCHPNLVPKRSDTRAYIDGTNSSTFE
jgi:hypothetical protein